MKKRRTEHLSYDVLTRTSRPVRHKWFHILSGLIVVAVMGVGPGVYVYNKYGMRGNVGAEAVASAADRIAKPSQSSAPSATPEPTPTAAPVTVSVLNGSGVTGAAKRVQELVEEAFPDAAVTASNASSFEYEYTLISDKSGTHDKVVQVLAGRLAASPAAHTPQDVPQEADILIIVGANYTAE